MSALPPRIAMNGQSCSTRNRDMVNADIIVIITIIQGAIK